MNNRDKILSIKKRLKYTWPVFFSHYGNLTNIQIYSIPKILEQKNVLILSPTASGKTEAVLSPLIEDIFFISKKQSSMIIYIVPTRALANDIYLRIENKLKELNISCSIKHGDYTNFDEFAPPNVLITTPESLDSLLCRHSKIFENLVALIVDEIHSIDNTYRGDQLRCLIRRLSIITQKPIRIHLLSATISKPEVLAKRYTESCEIITSINSRVIKHELITIFSEQDNHKIIDFIKENRIKKSIIFCNSRKKVEKMYSELKTKYDYIQFAKHHAGLTKKEREETEELMKYCDFGVCISTSTLEVGIDIGDIDLVILNSPPPSISSFLQRIGRGNRRVENLSVLVIATNELEVHVFKQMIKSVELNRLEYNTYISDKSVVVQQILSLLFQYPDGIGLEYIQEVVSPLIDKNRTILLLQKLLTKQYIEFFKDKYYASQFVMDLGEKGSIHSNIDSPEYYKVINSTTEEEIGILDGKFDRIFLFQGKIWSVVRIKEQTIIVEPYNNEYKIDDVTPSYLRGKFSHLMC